MPIYALAEIWSTLLQEQTAPSSSVVSYDSTEHADLLSEPARALLRAVELSPHSVSAYRSLVRRLEEEGAHPLQRVEVLSHAMTLSPGDDSLSFEHTTSLIRVVEHHMVTPNRTRGEGSDAAVRMHRRRAIDAVRRLTLRDSGRYSITAHASLGRMLYQHGKAADAIAAYSRAAMLMMGPWCHLSSTASLWKDLLEPGLLFDPLHAETISEAVVRLRASDERRLLLEVLHGLDCALQRQRKRRRAALVHGAGVALGVWPHALHRPLRATAGRLLSCAVHRSAYYGPLVARLEAAAADVREEALVMLRRRAERDPDELAAWYTNQEGVSSRPTHWIQRHLGCSRGGDGEISPVSASRTCAALEQALGWYYGAGAQEGMPRPIDGYWGKASISLIGPGQHIRPHTGPTNERLAISLGLDGALDAAELRVGGVVRTWPRGGALVFDDSFEHEVRLRNSTPNRLPRLVLIVHVLHPQLMPAGTNGAALADSIDAPEHGACEEGGYGMVDWLATD